MQADAGIALKELRVDGGATRNDLLMQFQADILGVPVVRPQDAGVDRAGRGVPRRPGSRLLAGCGRDRPPVVGASAIFEPRMDAAQRADLLAGWQRALDRAKAWEPASVTLR